MLNKPSLKELMKHVDSKYALVIIAAKRARAVVDENPQSAEGSTENPVSVALKEIAGGELEWTVGSPDTEGE